MVEGKVDTSAKAGSHKRKILAHLETGMTLTPMDALNLFGCFRLGARIWDLKRDGHEIRKTSVVTPSGKRVAEYRLINN